jgi:uncharacterized protein (DUF305 family)
MSLIRRTSPALALLATALLFSGCASPAPAALDGVKALTTFSPPTAPTTPDDPPSDVDLTFARQMIIHHEQAVRMSVELLKRDDADGVVADLAAFIERDQQREITAMQDWLTAWQTSEPALFKPEPQSDVMTAAVGADGGMVSHASEQGLTALGGAPAQLSFLRLMIMHHEGAIDMARALVEHGTNAFTHTVAKHILAEQAREVKAMQQVIDQMCSDTRRDYCADGHH